MKVNARKINVISQRKMKMWVKYIIPQHSSSKTLVKKETLRYGIWTIVAATT